MQNKILTKTGNSLDFNKFKTIFQEFKEKLNLSSKQLLNLLEKENLIPTSIFSTKLAPLEALTKYLKENFNFNFSKIARLLNRDQRTIWSAYQSSKNKKIKLKIKSEILIPISIFSNRKFSILESITTHLKKEFNYTFHKIAVLLNRDDRTIWTCYSRAKKKNE